MRLLYSGSYGFHVQWWYKKLPNESCLPLQRKKNPIQFDNKGEPLLSDSGDIKYIIENRNHDISVADCGAGAIVVVI